MNGLAATVAVWLLFAGAIALAVRRLRWGVFLWMALAGVMMVPLCSVRHSAVYFSAAYLTALLVCQGREMLRQGRFELAKSRLTTPLATLAVIAVLSWLHGMLDYDPTVAGEHRSVLVEIYASAIPVLSVAAAFLVARTLDSGPDLKRAFWIVTGVGVLMLASLHVPVPLFTRPRWWPVIVAYAVSLLYAAILYAPGMNPWLKMLGIAVVADGVGQVFVLQLLHPERDQWVSGWVMIVVPLLWITSRRCQLGLSSVARLIVRVRDRGRWRWTAVGCGMAALLVSLPLLYGVLNRARAEQDFDRFYIWADAVRVWLVRPVLGVGPGNYVDYAQRYAQGRIVYTSAHGNYQQILAEMGMAGLIALVWLLLRAVTLGVALLRSAEDAFVRSIAAGIVGGLLGQICASVLGDYLIPAYHNGGHTNFCATVYTWMMIGILVAIETGARKRPLAAAPR